MFKNYEEFLSEGIVFQKSGGHIWGFRVEETPHLEELKKATKLKEGDSVKFTGPKYMIKVYVESKPAPANHPKLGHRIDYCQTVITTGEKINKENLTFLRWLTKEDATKYSKMEQSGHDYDWKISGSNASPGILHMSANMLKAFMGVCKNEAGEEVTVSFFTYNPKYQKATPKVPDILPENIIEVLGEKIFRDLGIEDFEITESLFTKTQIVRVKTWFVYVKNHLGENAKVAGPFGKKADAEKKMKEIGEFQGDLDTEKLKRLRLRVDSTEGPKSVFVDAGVSEIPFKEFTSVLRKNYDVEKMANDLRGKIHGKKFNI